MRRKWPTMKVEIKFTNNLVQLFPNLNMEKIKFGDVFFDYINGVMYGYISSGDQETDFWRKLGGKIGKNIMYYDLQNTYIDFKTLSEYIPEEENIEKSSLIFEGVNLSFYRFDHYKKNQAKKRYEVKHDEEYKSAFEYVKKQVDAVNVAKDLCNEPANYLTPALYSRKLLKLFEFRNVEIEIMNENELKDNNMEAILTVGKGSHNGPRLAVIKVQTDQTKPLTALVGKGVTFDSGGINVKTSADIGEMKMDMGGSAAVIGALLNIVDNDIEANIIAVIPMVENLSGSNAYLPSTVIKYANEMHVEVGNTDAEGRLVLADGILYAVRHGAENIIDIATLTGSVGTALGLKYAGIYSNDESFVLKSAVEIGRETGDYVWPMPLAKEYDYYLKSDTADFNNMSSSPFGGSITAAVFLNKFIDHHIKWIHIDMANTVRPWKIEDHQSEGAAGYGVKLLSGLVKELNREEE